MCRYLRQRPDVALEAEVRRDACGDAVEEGEAISARHRIRPANQPAREIDASNFQSEPWALDGDQLSFEDLGCTGAPRRVRNARR